MNRQDDSQFEYDALLAAEVEQLESWFARLATQYPEPACRVIETVKMTTKVAAGELFLNGAVNDSSALAVAETVPPSARTLAATKDAVRRELATVAVRREGPVSVRNEGREKRTNWAPVWGGLTVMASAALIALVVLPGYLNTEDPRDVTKVSALDDWAYVLTDSTSSDFDSDVEGFESDLNDLDDSFASLQDVTDELGTEDIEDAIDQLYSDSASFLDS